MTENPDVTLAELRKSLEQTTPTPKLATKYDASKVKNFVLQKAVPTLFETLKVCDEILAFVEQEKNIKELQVGFDSFAINVKKLMNTTSANLKKIDSVQQGLQERISRFDVLEAKYKHMIDNVNSVLQELERALKQM